MSGVDAARPRNPDYVVEVAMRGGAVVRVYALKETLEQILEKLSNGAMGLCEVEEQNGNPRKPPEFFFSSGVFSRVAGIRLSEVVGWHVSAVPADDLESAERRKKIEDLTIRSQEMHLKILKKQIDDLESGDRWRE